MRSRPAGARATARLTASVVLPTPPLVFPTANIILLSLRWQYGCAVAWFVMLRDIHLIGVLIPPRRPHPRCRRPAALAHLAVILDRAKRRSGLLKPFARGPDGMSQHSPITLRFRSEERRVGQECVRTCRSRGSPYP